MELLFHSALIPRATVKQQFGSPFSEQAIWTAFTATSNSLEYLSGPKDETTRFLSSILNVLFKVGVSSGEVFNADLRCLGTVNNDANDNSNPWIKGGDIELWSEVAEGLEGRLKGRVFRKNVMGRVKAMGGLKVTNLAFGGNKMFVTRKDQQAVEVWQGSTRGF
ncbi:hypothetical protein Gotur_018948 [Gossypium turneri]